MFSMPSIARRAPIAIAAMSLLLAIAPAALAARPSSQTLNPQPPDTYTCSPNGNGTICRSLVREPYGPDPTGIFCGTGAGSYEVLDTATRVVRATRYYDENGNLVRRERLYDFDAAHLSNPLTGTAIYYKQRNVQSETFGTAGDLDTATLRESGLLQFTAPGMGTIWHQSGVIVTAPDGTLLHQGGPNEVNDYYATGNQSLVAALCLALAV